jgi:dTDP-4-amino-4,6-dideoxygalactose transaminase
LLEIRRVEGKTGMMFSSSFLGCKEVGTGEGGVYFTATAQQLQNPAIPQEKDEGSTLGRCLRK